jgi:hypothetical protein
MGLVIEEILVMSNELLHIAISDPAQWLQGIEVLHKTC